MWLQVRRRFSRFSQYFLTSIVDEEKKIFLANLNCPLIFEEKQPRQHWKLGRIVELIISNDKEVRSAKLFVGKSKRYINRPINRLYPIEYKIDNDNCERIKQDEEQFDNVIENLSESFDNKLMKNRREAAKLADIRLRYLYEED